MQPPRKYRKSEPIPSEALSSNKKLASRVSTTNKAHRISAAAAFDHDTYLLPSDNTGLLQPESALDKTWRVNQAEIKDSIGSEAASKSFELRLDTHGPYSIDYTANGRHLAIAGRKGQVAIFDWRLGKLHAEMHLDETVRDVCWLHDQSFFAVAQKKYVYIYDTQGLEIHQLRNHLEVNKMQFLRYHFLLATVGKPGYLKYQDTSTGTIVSEHRTKLGSCDTMAQNNHSGIIHLGHQNGTVTLWSPSSSTPHVKLLAHRGPVQSISVDKDQQGWYMATSGLDSAVKVWDMRTWKEVSSWTLPKPAQSVTFSQRGLLAVGWGNHVNVYKDVYASSQQRPSPYMTNLFPSTPIQDLQFCPFEDLLGTGHSLGFTSLLIPGAGEPNFDSLEADPFESKRARQEREVNLLLDKIQPDQITMDREAIGKLARPQKDGPLGEASAQPKPKGIGPRQNIVPYSKLSRVDRLKMKRADEDESDSGSDDQAGVEQRGHKLIKEPKRRVKGKNKVRKRVERKKANIIDAKTVALQEKMRRQSGQ